MYIQCIICVHAINARTSGPFVGCIEWWHVFSCKNRFRNIRFANNANSSHSELTFSERLHAVGDGHIQVRPSSALRVAGCPDVYVFTDTH